MKYYTYTWIQVIGDKIVNQGEGFYYTSATPDVDEMKSLIKLDSEAPNTEIKITLYTEMPILGYMTLDNKQFEQLDQPRRLKLFKFANEITKQGFDKTLINFPDRKYDVSKQPEGSEYPEVHETNLPTDLQKELDRIWVSLK